LYLIIDATRGFEGQDQSFLVSRKNRKGVVILVNKWDLVEKKPCQPVITKRKSRINAVYRCLFFCIGFDQTFVKSIRSYRKVYENRQQRITKNSMSLC
jgi:GTP-binding protein